MAHGKFRELPMTWDRRPARCPGLAVAYAIEVAVHGSFRCGLVPVEDNRPLSDNPVDNRQRSLR